MTADRPVETIQTLLEAEEAAKTAIESARKARDTRLKQAAAEADAEIAQYRDAKEADYQAQLAKYAGASGETSAKIMGEAKINIKTTTNAARRNKQDVVDMLVTFVKNVDVSV